MKGMPHMINLTPKYTKGRSMGACPPQFFVLIDEAFLNFFVMIDGSMWTGTLQSEVSGIAKFHGLHKERFVTIWLQMVDFDRSHLWSQNKQKMFQNQQKSHLGGMDPEN